MNDWISSNAERNSKSKNQMNKSQMNEFNLPVLLLRKWNLSMKPQSGLTSGPECTEYLR